MDVKWCESCGRHKATAFFRKDPKRRGKRCLACEKRRRKENGDKKRSRVQCREKRREVLRKIHHDTKNAPCADCGVRYPFYVMDLDHRDPKTKEAGVSDLAAKGKVSIKRFVAEIAKCDVVCANCHRVRTHVRRVVQSLLA